MNEDADIRGVLEAALGKPLASLERRPSEYRTSFALHEIDVELASGERLELMFKEVGPAGLAPSARAAKPAFLYDPLREIEVYRDVLDPALGTPRFYAADTERGWLFIERVHGVELFQVGERQTWEAVARWLADMHAKLAPAAPSARRAIRYDRGYLELWPARAIEVAQARGDASATEALRPLAEGYEAVIARLLALPPTLIHGEFYASNVLVDAFTAPRRVAAVDWEQAGIGPGLVDLAALTAGRWGEADRAEIAAAYAATAGSDFDVGALEACRLHLALQWLGWSPGWTPPVDHRQDWLEEAVKAAARLGLGGR